MIVRPLRTPIFKPGQLLIPFLQRHLPSHVPEQTIIVVTSKIVALSENRRVRCSTDRDFVRLIRSESQFTIKTGPTWLTMKDGLLMAAAGIDRSNADGQCILLPRQSFESAGQIRRSLRAHFSLQQLGVIITDSQLIPLRPGVLGVALGYAGFHGQRDYRGKPDLFGRRLNMTSSNLADGLATAAVTVMGEGAEQQPLAIINNAPVKFVSRIQRNEQRVDPHVDIFRPLLGQLRRQVKRT